jgi:hypothetical protein
MEDEVHQVELRGMTSSVLQQSVASRWTNKLLAALATAKEEARRSRLSRREADFSGVDETQLS